MTACSFGPTRRAAAVTPGRLVTFKTHLLAPVLLLVAGSFVAGCSNADTASPTSSERSDHARRPARRPRRGRGRSAHVRCFGAARSREFSDLVTRITTYQDAVRKAETEVPATLRSGSREKDEWVVEHLLQQNLKPVILVGKRNSQVRNTDGSIRTDVKNAYGYLRRAVGVVDEGGGELVILTKPASIIEANEELQRLGLIDARDIKRSSASASGQESESSSERNAAPQGAGDDDNWQWEKNYPYSLTDSDLSRTLYERNIGAGIGRVTVRLKDSHLRVNGNLDAMAAGRWARPREAHAILTTNLDGQLLVEGAFDGAFGASSGNIEVYRKSFDIAAVGGFPLTFDFEIVAKCDLASNGKVNAQVGMRVDGGIRAGATYVRDQGFDTVWEPRWPAFSPVGCSPSRRRRRSKGVAASPRRRGSTSSMRSARRPPPARSSRSRPARHRTAAPLGARQADRRDRRNASRHIQAVRRKPRLALGRSVPQGVGPVRRAIQVLRSSVRFGEQ